MKAADPQIQVIRWPARQVAVPEAEILRYLGMGKQVPEARLQAQLQQVRSSFDAAVAYAACYTVVPVTHAAGGCQLGPLWMPGKSLARHLAACREAILLAATTGLAAERMQRRSMLLSPTVGLLTDACATAAIEAFCDALDEEWAQRYPGSERLARFSPGYGDLPLSCQPPLLELLQSARLIGLNLTASLLMLPQKSVSAIIGLRQPRPEAAGPTDQTERQPGQGCPDSCSQPVCAYRQKEEKIHETA